MYEPRQGIVLRAVYGAHLPATLRLPRALSANQPYFELRRYAAAGPREIRPSLQAVFGRAGMTPLDGRGLTFLIPFASLGARARAWAEVNADPEWHKLRGRVRLGEMAIYRRCYSEPSPKSLPAYISAASSR